LQDHPKAKPQLHSKKGTAQLRFWYGFTPDMLFVGAPGSGEGEKANNHPAPAKSRPAFSIHLAQEKTIAPLPGA